MNETTARETVAKLASKQAAKLASKQAATGGTTNQAEFAAWLLEASGYNARNERERKAFLAAAMLTVPSYKVWQAAKPTSSNYTAAKPRRARKAAK